MCNSTRAKWRAITGPFVATLLLVSAVVIVGIILWVEVGSERREYTKTELQHLRIIVQHYVYGHGDIAGKTVSDIIEVIGQDVGEAKKLRAFCGMIVRQGDAWGRPLVLQRKSDTSIILIYSVGRNGCDESGGGDDIVVEVRLDQRSDTRPGTRGQS